MRFPIAAHLVDAGGGILCRPDAVARQCARHLEAGLPSPVLDLLAVDVCSVPQPDRQRGTVHMRGCVTLDVRGLDEACSSFLGVATGAPVARFEPESITLRRHVPPGASRDDDISTEDYALARPDALAGWEADWLCHLDGHREELLRVVQTRHRIGASARVHALQADERGLDIRVYDGAATRDVRVPFPCQVRCRCHAVEAFNDLVAASAS